MLCSISVRSGQSSGTYEVWALQLWDASDNGQGRCVSTTAPLNFLSVIVLNFHPSLLFNVFT